MRRTSKSRLLSGAELIKSETISLGLNFPDQQLEFETASLSDDVGYIRFNQFALQVISKFCSSVTQLKDKKALIIDLRGNSGGVIAALAPLGGMLSEDSVDFGAAIYYSREEKMIAEAKLKNFKGKLVFLVDGTTASAAEMFAVSFQESGRALVVGEKTAGASLPSMVTDLPTGAVMQYPIANYRSAKGAFLEGVGVIPNYQVALDRKSLSSGQDLQMEKALSLIRENSAFKAAGKEQEASGDAKNKRMGSALNVDGPQVSGSSPMPPPPPPSGKLPPAGKVLAEVTVRAPAPKVLPRVIEPAAVKILEEFIKAVGGREQLEKLKSYEITGKAELLIRGSNHEFRYGVYRQSPDRYAEIMSSDSAGEIRQVYNGKNYFSQNEYGFLNNGTTTEDTADIQLFSPLFSVLKQDAFASLKFAGSFERDGRKVNLIDAMSKDGSPVAFAFDVETKMLSYYTGPNYGMTFGDYRKAGDLFLPFRVEREGLMRLTFDEMKINAGADDSKFSKKVNCYDVPN